MARHSCPNSSQTRSFPLLLRRMMVCKWSQLFIWTFTDFQWICAPALPMHFWKPPLCPGSEAAPAAKPEHAACLISMDLPPAAGSFPLDGQALQWQHFTDIQAHLDFAPGVPQTARWYPATWSFIVPICWIRAIASGDVRNPIHVRIKSNFLIFFFSYW